MDCSRFADAVVNRIEAAQGKENPSKAQLQEVGHTVQSMAHHVIGCPAYIVAKHQPAEVILPDLRSSH